MVRLLVLLLRLYQLTLSRLLVAIFGPVCRFTPSCSAYAIECIRLHGAFHGSLLSLKRVGKCHPFHPGGYDPPPPPRARGRVSSNAGGPSADLPPTSSSPPQRPPPPSIQPNSVATAARPGPESPTLDSTSLEVAAKPPSP